MKRPGTEIYSIFGQIEEAAAETMIERGQLRKIEAKMIPAEALYNKDGERAKFAVIVPRDQLAAFEELIASLRA